jgi:NADH:ubiquinone reductase (H+-translocating)
VSRDFALFRGRTDLRNSTGPLRSNSHRLRSEKTKPFRCFDKGSLATIARNQAVAEIGPFQFSGILAWLAWLFIHLLYIVEFENRLVIVVHWAYDYFTRNRGARLITGEQQK